jgi:ubiquinone/menaquinone biosynthesis C-methylase UbiE
MPDYRASSDHDELLSYYEGFDEDNRLTSGVGLLEFARMQELILRFLSSPPGVVLDVGGGPGRYACWLARNGYEVHLVDPVRKHVDQARKASNSQPDYPLASIIQGDARSLRREEESVNALLLMGPLYHLPDRDQRLMALREANRVLKPGGMLVAKAINRFASLMDGLISGYIDDPSFIPVLCRDLDDGQHWRDENTSKYFTTSFFHLPEELEAEVLEAGFEQKGLYSVQGPGRMARDLDMRMSDPAKRAQLLDLIRTVEQEKTLLGIASHFVVVAQKPSKLKATVTPRFLES